MVVEQTTAQEEQLGAETEPSQVAVSTADAVAPASEQAVAAFDLNTLEGIRAAAEQNPQLKAWREEGYGAGLEAGKQRTLAQIQREQGSLERAQDTVRWAAEQISKGADPDEIAKQMAPHVTANQSWTRAEIMRGLIAQARTLDEEAVAPLAELADALEGNADEIQKVAQAALNAVANKSGATARQSILDAESLDAVPKDSKLYKAIRAEIEKEAATEVNAQKTEANKVPAGPKTPAGTATNPMTKDTFEAMSHEEQLAHLATLSDVERDAMWDLVSA